MLVSGHKHCSSPCASWLLVLLFIDDNQLDLLDSDFGRMMRAREFVTEVTFVLKGL